MRKVLLAATLGVVCGAPAFADRACDADIHFRFDETRAFFRDALGACRPDGYCSVTTPIAAPGPELAYLQNLRIARPTAGAPYQVELTAVDPMSATPATPMTLAVGARTFTFEADDVVSTGSVNEFRIVDQAVADAVVAALKPASRAVWTYQGEGGPAAARFRLRGLTAALTWVDCMKGP